MNSKWVTDFNAKHKTFRKKQRRKSSGSRARQEFFPSKPKVQLLKGKFDKLHFIKIKNVCSAEDPAERMQKLQTGRADLQSMHLTKDQHPEHQRTLKTEVRFSVTSSQMETLKECCRYNFVWSQGKERSGN